MSQPEGQQPRMGRCVFGRMHSRTPGASQAFCCPCLPACRPAGGYVGYAMTTRWGGVDADKLQMIGFDMGGTSTGSSACVCAARAVQLSMAVWRQARLSAATTCAAPAVTILACPFCHCITRFTPHTHTHCPDVSRYAGRYEHVFESTTAGVTIQAPQLDINTVAAGGGSRLFFRSGIFQVRAPLLPPDCLGTLVEWCSSPTGGLLTSSAAAPPLHAAGGARVCRGAPGARVLPQERIPGNHRWGANTASHCLCPSASSCCYDGALHAACHRRWPTLTALLHTPGWLPADANLVLGRILPQFFPHIFGPQEDEPLDAEGARSALGLQVHCASSGDTADCADQQRGAVLLSCCPALHCDAGRPWRWWRQR